MHHSNDIAESSALVAMREVDRRRRHLTARDVLLWPARAAWWLISTPVRSVYNNGVVPSVLMLVGLQCSDTAGLWAAGRERSSFLGRPGATREAKGLKPDHPEIVKLQAQLDEFRVANVQLQAESARKPDPVVIPKPPRYRKQAPDPYVGSPHTYYQRTCPTNKEGAEATRLLQEQRQQKSEAEDQADRERNLREGRAAMLEDERQLDEYIQRVEEQARRNKGKRKCLR